MQRRRWSAPLCVLGLLLSLAPQAAPLCPSPQPCAEVQVAQVIDGDTLELSDGRRVRLVGLDTPELARRERPAEPFALAAQEALQAIVARNRGRLALCVAPQTEDRYGRLLAHLYDAGGSVAAQLLAAGWALPLTIAPNTMQLTCYQRMSRTAQAAMRGAWGAHGFGPFAVTELEPSASGLLQVHGRVSQLRLRGARPYLVLDRRLKLRLPRNPKAWPEWLNPDLRGQSLSFRGRIKSRLDGLSAWVGHPSSVEIYH